MNKQTINPWTWQERFRVSQAGQVTVTMDNVETVLAAGGIATEVPALAVPGMAVEVTVTACR